MTVASPPEQTAQNEPPTAAELKAAAVKMSTARTQLLLDTPFFGTLALRLKVEPEPGMGTMGTDGTSLYYDPKWVNSLPAAQIKGLWAHEVLHCALGHPWRMGERDPQQWNEACDAVINERLKAEKFSLPDGGIDRPDLANLAAEEAYRRMGKRQRPDGTPGPGDVRAPAPAGGDQGSGNGQGQGQPDPNAPPTPGQDPAPSGPMTEAKWKVLAEQAALSARKAGDMSGDLDRALSDSRRAETPWREVLRDFLAPLAPNTPTYCPPNRRMIHAGLILPGKRREDFPRIGVAVDTSGSVDQDMLATFARELSTILQDVRPERIDVVYCDSRVRGWESFSPDDGTVVLNASGGGGTRFQPALDHFNQDPEGPPAAVVYLTDLQGPAPEPPKGYEVLWAVPERYYSDGCQPFGRAVKVRVD